MKKKFNILDKKASNYLYKDIAKNSKRIKEKYGYLDYNELSLFENNIFEDLYTDKHKIKEIRYTETKYFLIAEDGVVLPANITNAGLEETLKHDRKNYSHTYTLFFAALREDKEAFMTEMEAKGDPKKTLVELNRGQKQRNQLKLY